VPCFNSAATVCRTIESLQAQLLPIDQLFVVDDGSTDSSVTIAEAAGVPVLRNDSNLGRGAVRARAMREAKNEFVVCCDSSKSLMPGFVDSGLMWFEDPKVAAVCARIVQPPAENAVERWRGRHMLCSTCNRP